ncbi:hypothetical protein B0I72DRAFT_162704 [Yarrowia lipolytica]|uniref:Uncharacterized protein n=1 Tax=Yarrowia lipolytica TaxID=4952 RepID=A0A371BWX4_YARLL|nr:hypothetical protein B0I71DRAFT_170124 [Yarrowia lipolytica]RDW30143.1 hypothetical protein B0I72DRAFT_162704 [Yarrowia lipolytica]RDW41224.1 hypothetical protein B0I73DRAFT_167711 [Yarrowia lipolytica]RDW43254.1 hypothetical protein B0I74DRAFT_118400 [Yarrowia lipolytica]RDW50028.1 hypothetical protein B0I75DRAFT_167761 [Yarrowia lipolytica]
MLFKSLSILTAATAALAADQYTLKAAIGPGATGLKPLQLHGNNIVYGLTTGYSDFRAEDDGNTIKLIAQGFPGLSLDVAQDGELIFKSPPEPKEGFSFKGDGLVKDFEFNDSQEFYSCIDKTVGPLHPPIVYVKTGDKYGCKNPVKFTIAATKE